MDTQLHVTPVSFDPPPSESLTARQCEVPMLSTLSVLTYMRQPVTEHR